MRCGKEAQGGPMRHQNLWGRDAFTRRTGGNRRGKGQEKDVCGGWTIHRELGLRERGFSNRSGRSSRSSIPVQSEGEGAFAGRGGGITGREIQGTLSGRAGSQCRSEGDKSYLKI